jgi:hypothetical protein
VLDEEGIKEPPKILQAAVRDTPDVTDIDGLPTEDPDQFAAAYDIRMDRTHDMELMLSDNFGRMLDQLASIPGIR